MPWPGVAGGVYFWQHCYWIDTDDWTNIFQANIDINTDFGSLYTSQVRRRGNRIYDAVTGALLLTGYYGSGNPCSRPARPNPTLLIAAKWYLFGDDGSESYHLHRAPIGEDDLENGGWSTAGYGRQVVHAALWRNQGYYRTKTGALITSERVRATPIGWQLRHGTKRRNRQAWGP